MGGRQEWRRRMVEWMRRVGCSTATAGLIALAASYQVACGIEDTTLARDGASEPADASAPAADGDVLDAAGPSCMSGVLCDTGNPCEVGATQCVDGKETCMPLGFAPEGAVCRPAAGLCDIAETCSGSSKACPPDSFRSSGNVCRDTAGSCDVAETCTGSSAACPDDSFRPSGRVCRDAVDSTCDVAETCTGSSAACPADLHEANGTACEGGLSCEDYECSAGSCRYAHDACPAGMTCGASGCECESSLIEPSRCQIDEPPTIQAAPPSM